MHARLRNLIRLIPNRVWTRGCKTIYIYHTYMYDGDDDVRAFMAWIGVAFWSHSIRFNSNRFEVAGCSVCKSICCVSILRCIAYIWPRHCVVILFARVRSLYFCRRRKHFQTYGKQNNLDFVPENNSVRRVKTIRHCFSSHEQANKQTMSIDIFNGLWIDFDCKNKTRKYGIHRSIVVIEVSQWRSTLATVCTWIGFIKKENDKHTHKNVEASPKQTQLLYNQSIRLNFYSLLSLLFMECVLVFILLALFLSEQANTRTYRNWQIVS